ncbi:hypothetical protein [Nonomuraea aurantiaca]|uniref:hypothetical protein n=1 Tax=Nonomuraea aurantiaca TaxID=2878562 RepID=UPI001CD963FA|nr:hypothetical protein [Nonomuraea aurantiaca]MCA2228302.1 hypothetical protein [Nonomuraea aurantiaca]
MSTLPPTDPARPSLARHLEALTLTPPSVELSELAEDAVLTGAIQMALDEVWRDTLAVC